ncbi:hypothetical protein [Azospirillum baldaniorum]|nr:hypothetical protein [Azospirillum baldaniorum]
MQTSSAFRCRIGRLLAALMLCGALAAGAVVPSALAQSAAPAAEAAADFKTKLPQWAERLGEGGQPHRRG